MNPKLSKVIKKEQAQTMTALTVNGILNSDDFAYLEEFSKLQTLNIKNVKLTTEKEKKHRNYVSGIAQKQLTLPSLIALKEITIPSECSAINIKTPFDLESLTLPSICYLDVANGNLKVKNVHVFSVNGEIEQVKFKEKLEVKHFFTRNAFVKRSETDFYTSYLSGRHNIKIDTLYISSAAQLQNIAVSYFDPYYILIEPIQQLVLNRYPPKNGSLDEVDVILEGAFMKANLKEITIPSNIKAIPDYCFAGCQNLESVTFHDSIFYIGRSAFAGTKIKEVILPSRLNYICYDAFENCNIHICKLQSSTPPRILRSSSNGNLSSDLIKLWKQYWKESIIEIPQGSFEKYNREEAWRVLNLNEKGSKRTYNITIKEPGTILSHLPLASLTSIDSLTITGFLYDTDLNIIKKCKSLKYIDIRHTFISESPETIRAKQKQWEEFSAYTQLMGVAAEMAYKDRKISTAEFLVSKGLAELGKTATEFNKADDNCFIPSNTFIELKQLKTAKLPLRAVSIGHRAFSGCINLENVELPPYIEIFGEEAFADCRKLKISKFPASITEFYSKAFARCTSLKKVDLSNCTIKGTFDFSIFDKCQLEELRLPNGIETVKGRVINGYLKYENSNVINTVYFPATLKNMEVTFNFNCNLHFKSKNPPSTLLGNRSYKGESNTIYIPKGCTTAYYSAFGDSHSYKEE